VGETFQVDGTLSVRGGDGERGTQIGSANAPKVGGYGACGGGTGGDGSPSTTQRDPRGATGNGPLERAGGGGTGGALSSFAGCNRGSGGGGGSLATQGDPYFPARTVPPGQITTTPTNAVTILPQQIGDGGTGCSGAAGDATRSLPAGAAGPKVFVDSPEDNNFWGSAVDFNITGRRRITGELAVPLGGGGGGGGGDLSYNNSGTIDDPNFNNDSTGGGGGGGGGVLIVKALGDIIISETGTITADGGSGGGGEVNGACSKGGGGGAGAGGMVILMSATNIVINVHGGNYSQRDYDFSISADGGICRTGNGQAPRVLSKYPANGQAIASANFTWEKNYDLAPLGGFGGMGIVQLMAPPGDNSDGTNTVLDDHIILYRNTSLLESTAKVQALAWRGFYNSQGREVDDSNVETNIGANEGDIRPSPILMPTPFASKTRLRSHWIDTGASSRRRLVAADGLARGKVVGVDAPADGPTYAFAGTVPGTGYVDYSIAGELATIVAPPVGAPIAVQSVATETYRGEEVYQVELATNALGTVVDLYVQDDAELLNGAGVSLGSFRIVQHSNRVLRLSTESGALPAGVASVQLRQRYISIVTNGVPGLGGTYPGSVPQTRVPQSNLRIGFAFHQNPSTTSTGSRYPTTEGEYLYNLSDSQVQTIIQGMAMPFIQYDLLFDGEFQSVSGDRPLPLGPDTPRPELHFLRVPFRF
ncbi:MAG: hypothetical protein KDC98_08025, partial [Planctomycetes bacterium]|nr:hypothetical protein [Planctomycetota bacterium]